MKTLSVIVCNNGLGHAKRVLWIIDGVLRSGSDAVFEVFVDKRKLRSFAEVVGRLRTSGRVRFHDIQTDVMAYEAEFMARYASMLKDSDIIWSDNLAFPLKYHPRVFLTGQFVWSEIIGDKDFKDGEVVLLKDKRPIMIGIEYLATPRVKELTDFQGTGFYNYYPVRLDNKEAKGMLIGCGGTESANRYFEGQLDDIVEAVKTVPKEIAIFVEPRYFDRFPKQNNIRKADFTEAMFEQIKAAVIRPGIGTVCDVLTKGARIFAFSEGRNFEIDYNASVLEKLGVGQACGSVGSAIKEANVFLKNVDIQQKHVMNIRKLDFKGLENVIKKILEKVNNNYVCL